jgi:hypothetical protein
VGWSRRRAPLVLRFTPDEAARLSLVTVYGSPFTVFLKLFHLFARRRVAGGGKVQQLFGLAPAAFQFAEPAQSRPKF